MKIAILLTTTIGLTSCFNSTTSKILHRPNHYLSQFHGIYEYDNYQTDENLGTGVGVFYEIKISKEFCQINIVGYQTDKHLECYTNLINNTRIEIYDIGENKKFGTIQKTNENKFKIDMSYYLEGDNYSYYIEKVK